MTRPLKYTDDRDPAWSAAAVDGFTVTGLPDHGDPVMLALDGRCPRCADRMRHIHNLVTFAGMAAASPEAVHAAVQALRAGGALSEPLLPAEFSVQCSCDVPHPDPLGRTGLKGCGATWKMRIDAVDGAAE